MSACLLFRRAFGLSFSMDSASACVIRNFGGKMLVGFRICMLTLWRKGSCSMLKPYRNFD
jgi:hypothetical protein